MTRYDLLDIKAALDKASNWAHSQKDLFQMIDAKKKVEAMLNEPSLPGIEENGIPGKDFIPVEWVDACDMYGKWEIVKVEQPKVDLMKEINEYMSCEDNNPFDWDWRDKQACARHFYELGRQAKPEVFDTVAFQKGVQEGRRLERDEPVTDCHDLEKEIKEQIYERFYDLDGIAVIGTSGYAEVKDMEDIARHFAEWGAEHLKK